MTRATLFDGTTAFPHAVRVEVLGPRLRCVTDEGHAVDLDAALLKPEGDASERRFGRSDLPGWRLRLDEPPAPDLAALLPKAARYGGFIDRIGLGRASLVLGGIAAAVLFVGYSAPTWLAPHVPQSWERNLGTAIVGDFGDNRCRSAEGQRALEALAERVSPGATRGPEAISLAALDVRMVNAAALPGRHVVFFDGMIKEARTSDELAGIMAHEIAHVRRRHVTEALLRELGIGALVRLFAGGVGANAEQLMSLSYTRDNEAEADRDAIAMLRTAGIDPRPTATLLRRLDPSSGKSGSVEVEWLGSHPGIEGRARRFADSAPRGATYRPSLPEKEGDALFNICWTPPEQE